MHALKFRRRAYRSTRPETLSSQKAKGLEAPLAAAQILVVGLLSGMCCFTGSLLFLQVLQP